MSNKPIVWQLPNGEEYGFESESVAAKNFPEGKAVRFQDGSALEDAKPKATKPADKS